jgi:hypothetical protein
MTTHFEALSQKLLDLQMKRANLKEAIISNEGNKAVLDRKILKTEWEAEVQVYLGTDTEQYKTGDHRKAGIKKMLLNNLDYQAMLVKVDSLTDTNKRIDLDLRRNQIEISFIERQFQIAHGLPVVQNNTTL